MSRLLAHLSISPRGLRDCIGATPVLFLEKALVVTAKLVTRIKNQMIPYLLSFLHLLAAWSIIKDGLDYYSPF